MQAMTIRMVLIWSLAPAIASGKIARPGRPRHNDAMVPDSGDGTATSDPTYAFKPSLMGAMSEFTLRPDTLDWQIGRRSGRIRYNRVEAVRLSYRPVTMQSHRFLAEIWSAGNPKIQISSVSWRSMVEQERLDAAYAAFIGELHRRLAAAGAPVRLSTGLPHATYWIGLIVFAVVMAATAILTVRAMMLGQWSAAAIIGAFFAVFAYQVGNHFRRNRPGRYRADAIPPGIMPQA
jgi:hypothetical protein